MKTVKFDFSAMIATSGRANNRPSIERAFRDMTRYFERLEIDECSMDLSTIMSASPDALKEILDQ